MSLGNASCDHEIVRDQTDPHFSLFEYEGVCLNDMLIHLLAKVFQNIRLGLVFLVAVSY